MGHIILLKEHDCKWAKNKIMVFSKRDEKLITFNGVTIHNADLNLGNIIRLVNICSGDVFNDNSKFLCHKARKAILLILNKLRNIGVLPSKLIMSIFDTLKNQYCYMVVM